MKNYIVACGQITWGRETPQEQVLKEIAEAGYEGAPAGPFGGATPESVMEMYSRYGLRPGPGYMGANFWDPALTNELVERSKALADFAAAVGCDAIFVADGGFMTVAPSGKARFALAGHVSPADSLTPDQYKVYGEALTKCGEVFLARGVMACYHNHVGAFIETRQEIDDLWANVDRTKVFQGPDIGHLAWGGADVLQFCKDYAADIKCLHIKDIHAHVMQEGIAKDWTYREFSDAGIFAELGEGMVDFSGMFDILNAAGYNGWLVVETDRTTKSSPFESAKISREYLRSLGY